MRISSHEIAISFKTRLRRRELLHGFFIGQNLPAVVEMVGYAGFDFVIIDQEHGPADKSSLESLLRAADAAEIAAVVRVPSAEVRDILPALDLGASCILVPHITSAEQARNIVKAAHYPPVGQRGVSSFTRAGRYGLMPAGGHVASAAERTSVIAMIEDAEAVELAQDIASTDGLDGVFIGPTDLGASLGVVGQREHPLLLEAIAHIVSATPAGVGLATTAQTAAETPGLRERGFNMICHSITTEMARSLKAIKAETLLQEGRNP
ncbi:hypothetical protein FPY71_00445 [Aureimonas fodinaquatilis]|uniref:HpcH/HpaI aldolase/citrate lyase domain-containing protein n=1 Tax=Aureimonas fodinaquatilis TaxID=2565783 RepID=A0A5B0DXZ3_9HYPH|nr:aldolase/citrate lyase family protein [Aureimonas fodinaquatilis]KAA0971644.1 hypothetical protein FPY71_00445 [Aureimonas fodinaquatilis]